MARRIQIGIRWYPATKRRLRQWRIEVILPLIAEQAKKRGEELGERKRQAALEAERLRKAEIRQRAEAAEREARIRRLRENDDWARSQGYKDYDDYSENRLSSW